LKSKIILITSFKFCETKFDPDPAEVGEGSTPFTYIDEAGGKILSKIFIFLGN